MPCPLNVMPGIAFDPPLERARSSAQAAGNACMASKIWMLATNAPGW